MKEQNLDFEVARDFFTKTKYIIKMNLLSIGIVHDHEITQHMHCIMLCVFWEKILLLACFVIKLVVFI